MRTFADFAQLLGLLLASTALLLLILAARAWRRAPFEAASVGLHVAALFLLPAALFFLTHRVVAERLKTVEFCGSCHVMDPYVADLNDPESQTLAAVHHQNRLTGEHSCHACHSGYGLAGNFEAKKAGVRHVIRYYTGRYETPLAIPGGLSNRSCLGCHEGARRFSARRPHRVYAQELAHDERRCIECHGPAHP